MEIEIRPVTAADVAVYWPVRLRALHDHPEAFGASYEESLERPLEEAARRLANEDGSPDSFLLGAWDGDTLVGTMGMVRSQGVKVQHWGTIWGVYVAPEARGQGLGLRLLQAAIARARQIPGLEQLQLGVAADNTAARRLYQSAGFTVYGLEPRAMKLPTGYVDEELMILRLDEG